MPLNPLPPPLHKEAEKQTPEELFWIVKHGIKMTGMPASGPTRSDEDLAAIVAFLERLPGMAEQE